jgi:hypothetical protein
MIRGHLILHPFSTTLTDVTKKFYAGLFRSCAQPRKTTR